MYNSRIGIGKQRIICLKSYTIKSNTKTSGKAPILLLHPISFLNIRLRHMQFMRMLRFGRNTRMANLSHKNIICSKDP